MKVLESDGPSVDDCGVVDVDEAERDADARPEQGQQEPSKASRPDRTSPLTVISPIAPWWTPFARLVLEVLPHTPWGGSEDLQKLAFIQSARWAIVTGLPGAPGHKLKYDYLLFESNFNGTLESYLQAFTDVLGDKMRLIWNSSLGFPNFEADARRGRLARLRAPIPARPFVEYVASTSLPAAHYYSAYPTASTTEVLAGLMAERELIDLRGTALGGVSAQRFAERFVQTLLRLQGRPDLAEQPVGASGDVRGRHRAFTGLVPVPSRQLDDLRTTLARLTPGPASPFASVHGLHFGRWVVIDELTTQPGQVRDSWPTPYLLTSTTSDDDVDPLRALYRGLGAARDEVFRHCLGYPTDPDEAAFVAFHRCHQVRTSRFYTGYPSATVGAVRSGLDAHRRLSDFTVNTSRADPAQLLAAFEAEFLR